MKRYGDLPPIRVEPIVVPGVDAIEAGHRVVERSVPGWGYYQNRFNEDPTKYNGSFEFVCSCGWYVSGSVNKDGRASRHARVGWEGHLDAVRNEGLIITVGKIHRSRSSVTVQVMPSGLAVDLGFTVRGQAEYILRNPWLVCLTTDTTNTSKQRVLYGCYQRDGAIQNAREHIQKAGETHTVEVQEEAVNQITVKEETNRLVEAADRAIASGNLQDIVTAWEMFEDYERVRTIILAKRDELESAKAALIARRAG